MINSTLDRVGELLQKHIEQSKAGKTPALNQQAPETIANELKLKERLASGFQDQDDFVFCRNLPYPYQSLESSALYGASSGCATRSFGHPRINSWDD